MSKIQFFNIRVANVRRETADCVSIALDIPNDLKATFAFKPGQYITFKKELNGEELRRSYSICSGINDNELRVAVKKVKHGAFSTYANEQLKKGDYLEVMPPMGNFHLGETNSGAKNYVGFASGSGITPIFSILKSVLENDAQATFTLFYGNKNTASVIFKEAIEALKNQYMQRLKVYYVLSREFNETEMFNGRIDASKCAYFCEHLVDVATVEGFYLCGPEEMIFAVKDTLLQKGVAKKNIHFELFNTGQQTQKRVQQLDSDFADAATMSDVSVKLDGKTMQFQLSKHGANILDAAMQLGADLPYACKGGVCCTCKAKLVEGEVQMTVNYGLEEDEIANNYILTCQAHPVTEKVVVDFDI